MSDNAIDNITTAEEMGREQYETFSHLLKMDKPFNDNITIFSSLNPVNGKILKQQSKNTKEKT